MTNLPFRPRPYTDTQVESYRAKYIAQHGAELFAKHWDEACSQVCNDTARDERIASAILNDDMAELGNLMKDVIEAYITENYIDPAVDEWAGSYADNQISTYQELQRERAIDAALTHRG